MKKGENAKTPQPWSVTEAFLCLVKLFEVVFAAEEIDLAVDVLGLVNDVTVQINDTGMAGGARIRRFEHMTYGNEGRISILSNRAMAGTAGCLVATAVP